MLVLTAVSLTLVIASTAVAVDLGKAVAKNTDFQAVADLASLDAVRALGDLAGNGGGQSNRQHVLTRARESAARNGFSWNTAPNTLDIALGTVDTTTRVFAPAADQVNGDSTTNAVRVTVGGTVDWAFAPGSNAYTANAVAVVQDLAAMSLGSFLARIDTQNASLLDGLVGGFLGSNLSLDLLSYQGLAALDVSLAELADFGISAGTVDELLNVKQFTVAQLIDASIAALNRRGEVLTFNGEAPLTEMRAAATSTSQVKLGDFVEVVQPGGQAALRAGFNVLEFIKAAAIVSDGDQFLQLASPITIPGLAEVTVKVGMIEKPKFIVGPARQTAGVWATTLRSAQLRAQLDVRALTLVSGGVVELPIYLEAGSATAALTGITCTPGTTNQGTVSVAVSAQTARAAVGRVGDSVLTASSPVTFPTPATILDLLLLDVQGSANVVVPGSAGTLTFTGPYAQTQTRNSPTLNLGALLKPAPAGNLTLSTVGVDLGGVVTGLVGTVLTPILDVIDAAVINPLLSALGISLAGGDVTIHDLWCNARTLVN